MLDFIAESSPTEAILWTSGSAIYAFSCYFLYKQWNEDGDVYTSILNQDENVSMKKKKNSVGTYSSLIYIAFFSILFLHQVTYSPEAGAQPVTNKRAPTIMEFLNEEQVGAKKPAEKEFVTEESKIVQFYEENTCVTLPSQVPTSTVGVLHMFRCDEDMVPNVKIFTKNHCEGDSTDWMLANGKNKKFLWEEVAGMEGNKFGKAEFTCLKEGTEKVVKVEQVYKLTIPKCDPKEKTCDMKDKHVVVWECECEGVKVHGDAMATKMTDCSLTRATMETFQKSMDLWEDSGDAVCRSIRATAEGRRALRRRTKMVEHVLQGKRQYGPGGIEDVMFIDMDALIEADVGDTVTNTINGKSSSFGANTKVYGDCSVKDLAETIDISAKIRKIGEYIHKKAHEAYCGFGKTIAPDCKHPHAGYGYFVNRALDLITAAECKVHAVAFKDCTAADHSDINKLVRDQKDEVNKHSKKDLATMKEHCNVSSESEVGENEFDFEEARLAMEEEQLGNFLSKSLANSPFSKSWRCGNPYKGEIWSHKHGNKNYNCKKRQSCWVPITAELGLGVAIFLHHYGLGAGFSQTGDGVSMPYWGWGIGISPDYLGGWGEIYVETVKTAGNFVQAGATACTGVSLDWNPVISVGLEVCKGYGRNNYEAGVTDGNSYGVSISVSAGLDAILHKVGTIGGIASKFLRGATKVRNGVVKATNKHLLRGKKVTNLDKNPIEGIKIPEGNGSGLDYVSQMFNGPDLDGFEINLTWEYVRPFSAWCTYGNK